MNPTLPPFLRELLTSCPQAGNGVHAWLFKVARQLHAHLPAGQIVQLLEEQTRTCGRPVPRTEITAAVQSALPCAWEPSGAAGPVKPVSKWPSVNQEQRQGIVSAGGGLADLWELSPVRLEDNNAHTESIIDRLFPGNPLLCCGKSSREFDTKPREEWRGQLSSMALIVPSPMTALTGPRKADGQPSAHTLENTGPRRFLVVEFDQGTSDEHAAILIHLAHKAPLVVAVHSGNKSLHGWFLVAGQPEDKVLRFFQHAVSLGADSHLWTRSQFCRMPDGTRDNGKRQTVFFLNFRPLELLHE